MKDHLSFKRWRLICSGYAYSVFLALLFLPVTAVVAQGLDDSNNSDKIVISTEDNTANVVYMVLMSGSPPLHLIEMDSMKKCKNAVRYTSNAKCITTPEVARDILRYKVGQIGHLKKLSKKGKQAPENVSIKFRFDSTKMRGNSQEYLDSVGKMLSQDNNMRLSIEGHADSIGSSKYNSRLSWDRAIAIKRYLISVWNIDFSRLRALGKGEDDPLRGIKENNPDNRRVQFKVQ